MNKSSSQVKKRSRRMSWWVSILLAIAVYCGLKYLVPELCTQQDSSFFQLCQAAPTFAPLAAIPFLLLAGKQLYDSDIPKEEADNSLDS